VRESQRERIRESKRERERAIDRLPEGRSTNLECVTQLPVGSDDFQGEYPT